MFGDNGSGYAPPHVSGEERHQPVLWRQNMPRPRFEQASYYIGGVIKHAKVYQRPREPRPPTPTSVWSRVGEAPVMRPYLPV